jgi:hypothetical protein
MNETPRRIVFKAIYFRSMFNTLRVVGIAESVGLPRACSEYYSKINNYNNLPGDVVDPL